MSRLSVASADKVNSTTEQLMKEFTQRIVANPPGVCPVDMQLAFLKVCHAQTCGKCVPCRVGLGQLERLLEKVLDNEATMETLELIEETAENIKNSADCAIGFESARMVLAGLEGFREDYISHITDHRCLGSFEQPIPCVTLCPAHVDIPGYIALVREGRYEDAIRLIRQNEMVETLSYNENEIQAVFKGEREDEVMLLHELMAADIPVYSFGRDRSSLETLFMQITDREVKEHAHESGL